MEASPALVAAYEAALPDDPRVERKKMFGMPCAFLNRQMFYGTFEGTLVARVGAQRTAALVGQPGIGPFAPSPDRPWNDYVRIELSAGPKVHADLAAEALEWAEGLPPKGKKPVAARRAKKKG